MQKYLTRLLCFTLMAMLLSTNVSLAAWWNTKPTIVTTIYPLYEFTKQVVGDKADVVLLVPNGAEPHDWEPSPADLIKVKNASLVIYNGAGLEPWVDKIGSSTLSGKQTLSAASVVPLLQAQYDEEGESAAAGVMDPHVWLDPINAQAIVQAIAAAAAQTDPSNSDYYFANSAKYSTQLAELDNEYQLALASTARRDIITSHAAFGYLAARYGLNQIAIMGLSPDAEPTPERMAQVIRHVRSAGIKYIFFETLVSPKLSEIIASETGAQTLVLNPLEGLSDDEIANGENYVTVMRMNLTNLKYALGE
ncbi:metal ABC transporter solute-binding protein, Zn/Mn family [Anaerospora sp.]|uniref:metal ABC transporter solute-binding protein, Zn/Mn family n=1 Tax=Anaerospora sp. TaxID=1960278 RepID=UPI002897F251|nr:zinc ABC transporter substrate-binding protein [Anaerospora sp.]